MNSTDKSKVFLNMIVMTVSTIMEKVLFFSVNIIIARYLDLIQYGEYTTALAFASFFSLFTDMGISETLIREINYEKEKEQTLFNNKYSGPRCRSFCFSSDNSICQISKKL